jgi:hypothetical protein
LRYKLTVFLLYESQTSLKGTLGAKCGLEGKGVYDLELGGGGMFFASVQISALGIQHFQLDTVGGCPLTGDEKWLGHRNMCRLPDVGQPTLLK